MGVDVSDSLLIETLLVLLVANAIVRLLSQSLRLLVSRH